MKQFLKLAVIPCLLVITVVCLAIGCKPTVKAPPATTTATAPAAAIPAYPGMPTQAQPKLPTIKLWIGAQVMVTEMALSEIQEQTGMMYRTNMGTNEGMIFVFAAPMRASFWMMNTVLPLSAAYISPNGTILEIHDLQPHDTNAVVAESGNIQYVLETPQGWFKSNNISVGTVIKTERGSLQHVFFGN